MDQYDIRDKANVSLLLEIARCPEARFCLAHPERTDHPCAQIVHSQGALTWQAFQSPETWNGSLVSAPILFLSSNPAFASDEDYPTGDVDVWPDDHVVDFFEQRFGGTLKTWSLNGRRTRNKDGTFAPTDNRFWAHVAGKARDILGRDAGRGVDWALTEIVHCKSNGAYGVDAARARCPDRYLSRVLSHSGARLIVCLGRVRVWPTFSASFPHIPLPSRGADTGYLVGPAVVAGRERYVAFLEHPGAGSLNLSRLVSPQAMAELRTFISV